MNKRGYTLIEFLVVVGIVAVSVGSVLLILTSVIKSSNQSSIVAEVKQNGQAVLEDLERLVRSSTDIDVLAGGELLGANSGIRLKAQDNSYVFILCFNAVGTTSNGWIGIAKTATDNAPALGAYQSLTNNQSTLSGVDIGCGTAAFQVYSGVSNVQVVTINFTVNQGVGAPSRADFLANAQFKTVISMRQYN